MLSDLRYALRSLSRAYGFTLTVVATLALGIGAAAAIFSVTDWILFRSDAFPHKEQLFVLGSRSIAAVVNETGVTANPFIPGIHFQACQEQTRVFSEFAVSQSDPVNVVVAGEPIESGVRRVSADFFHTLGIVPTLGRGFLPEDFQPAAGNVVVINYQIWQEHFGGVPDVLGREIQVDQRPCRVIGVLPKDQILPVYDYAYVYQPLILTVDPAKPWATVLFAIGRLRPGVAPAQAAAALKALKISLSPQVEKFFSGQELTLVRLSELNEVFRPEIYWMLVGAVAFLYGIACLNATNLMLVRALGKRRELGIRLAMGGGRWRIVRLGAIESLGLSLLAGAAGILVTHWVFPVLMRVASSGSASWSGIAINWRVLGVLAALGVLTSALIAVVPAIQVFRADLNEGLKEGGMALGESPRLARLRNALVLLQAAFAVILLTGAGLMARTLQRLQHVDLGFEPTGKVKVQVMMPDGYHAEREDRLQLFQRVQERLRAIPGVQDVAFGSDALLPGYARTTTQLRMPDGGEISIERDDVSYDFLRTAGLTLVRGSWLPAKRDNVTQVVINESLARRRFGNQDPIGGALDVVQDGKVHPWQVVGVVRDTREAMRSAPALHAYFSDWWWPPNLSTFVVRLARDPDKGFEGRVRRAIYEFDAKLTTGGQIGSVKDWIGGMLWTERLTLSILKVLSGIALALAVVGLFSVLAYSVDRRLGEFGVRAALGATPA
ncbi:MAG TPA: ABC transporter permease, partial [Opitutaceae bacterium]|nr:ABC transporter permease [Opitutaceae bacterium]